MNRPWLGFAVVVTLGACTHTTEEEPYVDSGILTCAQENTLDGSFAFDVTQGAACFGQLPDGGPDLRAVTLQLAAQVITCEAMGPSPTPMCSGATAGDELYLQYGTVGNPQSEPLSVGTWPVANVDGGPWVTVFFTDNLGSQINAQGGEVSFSTLDPMEATGTLQDLVFPLSDGGVATLGGAFCTSFCGILPDGG